MFNLILGFIFLLIGVFFLILSLYNIYQNSILDNWVEIEGVITKSSITKKTTEYSIGTDPYSSSTDVDFEEKFEFEYTYKNKNYKSENIYNLRLNRRFLTPKMKEKLILKYPKGKKVTVYIDDNKKAFLENTTPITYTLFLAFISIVIGIVFIF